MKIDRALFLIVCAASFQAGAQTFDTTGNGMLNGKYYFREILFTSTDYVAAYGNITFSGGSYTISGAQAFDCNVAQGACGNPANFTPPTGTYSIAASGYGFIANQLINDQIYGLVGANGVFIGSSTESGNWDLFVAAPVTSQGSGTLQGNYSMAYVDPGVFTGTPFDAQLTMTPNGSGNIGNVGVTAYTGDSSSAFTQTISNVSYIVSNNAFVLNFPNSSSAVLVGKEYLYSTPDGSFVFGGSPTNIDMIIGVKTGSASGLSGLYYQAGFDLVNSQGNTDTYYGAFNAASSGAIVGHQRLQYGGTVPSDYTYYDSYSTGQTYTDNFFSTQYTIGANGMRIGLGIGPYLGLSVAVQAPTLSGSGVYLSPTGVINSASSAPFTAGVSRGELLELVGTGLGPSTLQVASTLPFPQTLGGVQVKINGFPAPLYYVSATQLAAIVPWEVTGSIARVQVFYNGAASNTVTEFINTTTPGIFTNPPTGVGYAAALHPDYSLVTPANPAQPGEIIAVFVTGLGDVVPSGADGAAGVFSSTTNTIAADINGVAAPISYAGLAPGLAGLYQLNITIPSGLTAGDNTLDIGAADGTSYSAEALISIAGSSTAAPQARRAMRFPLAKRHLQRFSRPMP